MADGDRYAVKATETSFEVVEAVRDLDGATVTELATALGLSKSAVHKHLQTLHRLGCVTRTDHTYHVGLKFLDHGTVARDRCPLHAVGRNAVDNLARTVGETASLVVHERDRAVFVYNAPGDGARPAVRDGRHVPLAECAPGRAILAYLDGERRPAGTGAGDADGHSLQTVRDQGLASGRDEVRDETRSVAAPVRNGERQAIGAVCVTGPTDRLSGKRLEEDISGLVLSTAQQIENSYAEE